MNETADFSQPRCGSKPRARKTGLWAETKVDAGPRRPGIYREGAHAAPAGRCELPVGAAVESVVVSHKSYVTHLFKEYRAPLQRYLARLVGPKEAPELVQETFLRVVRHADVAQVEAMARSLLFTTASNLARDYRRRQWSRHARSHEPFSDELAEDRQANPTEHMEAEQLLSALEAAIGALPEATRTVFVLSRFRDMTYPEIAVALEMSPRTVARKMEEAMEMLSRVIAADR